MIHFCHEFPTNAMQLGVDIHITNNTEISYPDDSILTKCNAIWTHNTALKHANMEDIKIPHT